MRFDYLSILGAAFTSNRGPKQPLGTDSCLNCGHKEEKIFKYCPNCGQKARESKLTFFRLIKELFSNILDIDSSAYRSFFLLPLPAYLSKKYIKGERKHYLNPIRFFFFSMIIFFALFVSNINVDKLNALNNDQLVTIEKSQSLEKFEEIIKEDQYSGFDRIAIDSLRQALYRNVKLPNIDTVQVINLDNSGIGIYVDALKLSRRDFYRTPISEVLDKMGTQPWYSKMIYRQIIRVNRDYKGAGTFFMGNGIWVIISTILMVSLFMKLLFIRRNRYLIEHSIILFHTHAFAFVIGSIFMIGLKIFPSLFNFIPIPIGLSILYVLLSFKIYYNQGWFKTLIKLFLISSFYVIAMSVLLVILLLLSLLLFN